MTPEARRALALAASVEHYYGGEWGRPWPRCAAMPAFHAAFGPDVVLRLLDVADAARRLLERTDMAAYQAGEMDDLADAPGRLDGRG